MHDREGGDSQRGGFRLLLLGPALLFLVLVIVYACEGAKSLESIVRFGRDLVVIIGAPSVAVIFFHLNRQRTQALEARIGLANQRADLAEEAEKLFSAKSMVDQVESLQKALVLVRTHKEEELEEANRTVEETRLELERERGDKADLEDKMSGYQLRAKELEMEVKEAREASDAVASNRAAFVLLPEFAHSAIEFVRTAALAQLVLNETPERPA